MFLLLVRSNQLGLFRLRLPSLTLVLVTV